MTAKSKRVRCAVYTRVSTEYGLDQEFNSLDAQHEASEAYIRSQSHDGWTPVRTRSGSSSSLQSRGDASGCQTTRAVEPRSRASPHARPTASDTSK